MLTFSCVLPWALSSSLLSSSKMQTVRATLPSAGWWEAGGSLGVSSVLCLCQLGASRAIEEQQRACWSLWHGREGNPLLPLPVRVQWGWRHWLWHFVNETLSSPLVWMLFLFSLLLFQLRNWEPHKDFKSEIDIYLRSPFSMLFVPSLFSWVRFLLHSPPICISLHPPPPLQGGRLCLVPSMGVAGAASVKGWCWWCGKGLLSLFYGFKWDKGWESFHSFRASPSLLGTTTW